MARPKGSKNKLTFEREALARQGMRAAMAMNSTPLEIMLRRMNGDASVTDAQFAAAQAAAPYIHPRLQSSDTTITSDNTHHVVADRPMTLDEWKMEFAPDTIKPHANDVTTSIDDEDEQPEAKSA